MLRDFHIQSNRVIVWRMVVTNCGNKYLRTWVHSANEHIGNLIRVIRPCLAICWIDLWSQAVEDCYNELFEAGILKRST